MMLEKKMQYAITTAATTSKRRRSHTKYYYVFWIDSIDRSMCLWCWNRYQERLRDDDGVNIIKNSAHEDICFKLSDRLHAGSR